MVCVCNVVLTCVRSLAHAAHGRISTGPNRTAEFGRSGIMPLHVMPWWKGGPCHAGTVVPQRIHAMPVTPGSRISIMSCIAITIVLTWHGGMRTTRTCDVYTCGIMHDERVTIDACLYNNSSTASQRIHYRRHVRTHTCTCQCSHAMSPPCPSCDAAMVMTME